jgi:TatD DNase family protein
LAGELDKPIIVHCRDAFGDVYDILDAAGAGPRAVLHCWTGGPRWTRRFDDLGVTFSFAGPITFETGQTIRLAAAVAPPDRTMVETDTPYLTPPPDRGAANEPANVVRVGEALAAVWSVSVEEVARMTTVTATRVFRG